ncbi:hypothetical protein EDI_081890 [Entamoeba dispar SAW760]|uniref:Uncharacterized protein n=1 Tax=Entamoeba dispar (strain ATCC PRA-260 / SAW760) TaxID=370354 RepID=B0ELL5_ENTDS|nr:uncharacterized protein EDI_081890 [Entamoeba dispar SAW760]EDR24574.1 hypothetical protein EDI_081890 [Entamoeba dispar SAW760]|eukprot:EDR24574.1 hypothetical protein EDI_081890 [Entamoeba dispar SAW760]
MKQRYLTLTNENTTVDLLTGKFTVKLPWEFTTSETPIKVIEIINFIYFNLNGQLDVGISCHASFNHDSIENDQMVCFTTYGSMTPRRFEIRRHLTQFDIWFKDYKGEPIVPIANRKDLKEELKDFIGWDEWFILELNLEY